MQAYYFNITDKKRISNWFAVHVFILSMIMLTGCRDIFEKNITDETVQVILPTASDTLNSNKVHFKWEEMEGASFYNIQIVKSSFADIDAFVLDSNINDTEFYQVLGPGDYEFKIRGENGAHKSKYAGPFSIYVDSVSDLSAQFVPLISPAADVYINNLDDLTVNWQNLFAAQSYQYILKFGSSLSTATTIDQVFDLTGLSYTIPAETFSIEGKYFWGIRGVNASGESQYSYRQINLDITRPNSPELISPIHEATADIGEVVLKWSLGTDPGTINSPVTSIVEISSTETFFDKEEFLGITTDSLTYNFSTAGDYWWRVVLMDEVGNLSETYSLENKITINE